MPTYVRSGGTWLDVSGGGSPSIPSGVSILFYEASAPLGWTKVTTQDNKALRVVSGTGGVTGGSTPFTSVFTSRNVSGTVANASLNTSQIPSHTHSLYSSFGGSIIGGGTRYLGDSGGGGSFGTPSSGSEGGNGSHNHGFVGTTLDFAVQYIDIIIARKD